MKSILRILTLGTVLGASATAIAAIVPFPNGDFETPDGAQWGTAKGGNHNFSFPATEGNPGGYARIVSNEGGGYAVLISNNDQPYPLASLGLEADKSYTFHYDMIASATGPNKGGIKIESWNAGTRLSDSGDQRVEVTAAGWRSYSYRYKLNASATHIKVVPLWTPNQTVGFDNIRVDNTPYVEPSPTDVVHENTFNSAGSNWGTPAGNSGATSTITWSGSAGNPGGATVLTVSHFQNPEPGAGSDAFLTYTANDVNFGLGPVEVSFDAKLLGALPGTAVHAIYNGNFVPVIMNELNQATFTTVKRTFQLSQGFTSTETFTLAFQFAMGPVPGAGGSIAIDNIRIRTILPASAPPTTASIESGVLLDWTPGKPGSTFQPQSSNDPGPEKTWVDVGPLIKDPTLTTLFDNAPADFYRVQNVTPAVFDNAVPNPGFELSDFSSTPADFWTILSPPNQGASITVDSFYENYLPFTGDRMLIITSTGPGAPAPNTDVRSDRFGVNPGGTYQLSFWIANPIKVAGANPQYSLFFFDSNGVFISNNFFDGLAGFGAEWSKFTASVKVPANASQMTIGWIQAASAEANVRWVTLIDDVLLTTGTLIDPEETTTLTPTATPSVKVSWPTVVGRVYQAQSSTSLGAWGDLGDVIDGDGTIWSVVEPIVPPRRFYQIIEAQ